MAIERVGVGGDGVGTAPDGRVVFVRGGLPGDVIEVRVTQSARRHLRAVAVRRTVESPDRVAPFCAQVEACGGCPWMPLPQPMQHAALRAHVQHQLGRALGEAAPTVDAVVAVAPDRAWRSTARLHWAAGRLGYHRAGGRDLLDLEACPVLSAPLSAVLTAVRGALLSTLPGAGTLRLTADAAGGTVALEPEAPLSVAQAAAVDEGLAALVAPAMDAPGAGRPVRGAVRLHQGRVVARFGQPFNALGPLGVPHPAEGFAQAHQPGNAALVAAAVAAVMDVPGGASRVLELYAGAGNFTVALLAAGAEVCAVEVAATGAEALRAEAERRGFGPRLRAVAGDAAHLPAGPFEVALIDPPRAGAAEAVAALHAAGLRRLVYVACDPATLARDLGWLGAHGWRVLSATPFDLFPHTGHVEVLAVVERTSGGSMPMPGAGAVAGAPPKG